MPPSDAIIIFHENSSDSKSTTAKSMESIKNIHYVCLHFAIRTVSNERAQEKHTLREIKAGAQVV